MPRFAKRHDCPASETLRAHAAGALSPLPRDSVGTHLSSCEFCAAESRLLARDVEPFETTTTLEMPLALRLFAQSRLAQVASVEAFNDLRAA